MNVQRMFFFRLMHRFRRAATDKILRGVLDTICKIDYREFVEALSKTEPLIIIFNHINFLEVPILVTHSYPFYCTGVAKSETWKNPFFSFLFNTYKAIPINRAGSYRETFRRVREAMDRGFYVAIAPEGTRSKDGILREGKAGIIQLAIDTNSPVLPVAHYGGQQIWTNLKHLKRTPLQFRAGRPFRIKCDERPGRTERKQILGEVMSQIARLLPVEMRGVYTQQAEQECRHLEFIDNNA